MMEFLKLETSEILTVIVLALIVIGVAFLGRRAQGQTSPAPPGDAPGPLRGDERPKRRSR